MKQDIRSGFWFKALAVLLSVVLGVSALLCWVYTVANWRTLFEEGDWTDTPAYNNQMNDCYHWLTSLKTYEEIRQSDRELTYLEQKRYEEITAHLSPENTNFRYIVRNNATGEILFSSMGEKSLEQVTDLRRFSALWGDEYFYVQYDSDTDQYLYLDSTDTVFYVSEVPDENPDSFTQLALEFGVDTTLPVHDAFYEAKLSFSRGNIKYFYCAVALSLAFLCFAVLCMCCAGRRRGADDFVLNWQDKIPYDLYLLCSIPGIVLIFSGGAAACYELGVYTPPYGQETLLHFLTVPAFTAAIILALALLMTTATRLKAHTLLKNTLCWRFFRWLGRIFRALGRWWKTTFGSWDLTQRIIVGFLLYLIGTVLTGFTVVLIPFYQGAVLFGLCKWSEEWRRIRAGTQAIVGGAPETVIDTGGMDRFICKDLKEHALQLNDLGSAINSAVDERMKSERMKAELITNVSHDLKTPLTSIINYVDLLKKEPIESEKAREYIEVLDRKSQRLKKLTTDLVEASKASTGALTVTRERLGVVQLVTQALGEYSEKLAAANLTMIPTLTEEEVYVHADGRHFWRVLDNLLNNCVKYAMPGTRVYLDLVRWDGNVILSLKNISAGQLNIPADQLMERFVRGDESRTTEGSGLGLSIARSLTELQGGTFRLEVDGDLFKAVVSLPEAK